MIQYFSQYFLVLVTIILTHRISLKFCPIRGSVTSSLIIIIFAYLIQQTGFEIHFEYQTLIFGASFIGMGIFESRPYFGYLFASIIYLVLYLNLTPLLTGIGGSLGFTAFLSYGISRFFHKLKNSL